MATKTRQGGYVRVETDEYGKTCYYDEQGMFHSEDGPAVVYDDGTEEWFLNGKLHREDGPAVIYSNGTEEWFLNGKLHREDGPALVPSGEYDSPSLWYWHGKEHREDGPSRVYSDGGGIYFLWGQRYGEVTNEFISMHEFCKPLPDETVAKAMKEHGFKTILELANWVMFEVLGEDAYEVLSEGNDNNLHYAVTEYLNNYEKYKGIPFSWWFPITSPGIDSGAILRALEAQRSTSK